MLLRAFFSFLFSFLVTFYTVPLMIRVARRLNVLDMPDGAVKKHKVPTPYLGGLAIFIGFIIGLALVFPQQNNIFSLLVGSTLLLVVGLVDDLRALEPYQKFGAQAIAAFVFMRGGLYLKDAFFAQWWQLALPLSFFWMLTIINALNLVDVMDGLATAVALGAAINFAVIAWLQGNQPALMLLSCLIGPLCAYLWYNKPPAQIYLGDAGALFLGGFLASVPFLFGWTLHNVHGFLVPAIVLAIPLIEVATLVLVRTWRGVPFYLPSPDHFCHYLRRKGWSIWQILLFVALVSCILGAIAVAFLYAGLDFWQLVLVGFVGLAVWYAIVLYGGQKI